MNFWMNKHRTLVFLFFLAGALPARPSSWIYVPTPPDVDCRPDDRHETILGGRIVKIAQSCLDALEWTSSSREGDGGKVSTSYLKNFGGPLETFPVGEVTFQGTSKERKFFLKLVGLEEEGEYKVPVDLLEKIKAAQCPRPIHVICALSSLYGQKEPGPESLANRKEAAMRAMNVAMEFGAIITPRNYVRVRSFEKVRSASDPEWSASSVRQIESVFRKLPPSFHHMGTVKYFYRTMESDQSLLDYTTNAFSYNGKTPEIVLKHSTFNDWVGSHSLKTGDHKDGSCTVAHELAHAFEFQYPEKVKELELFQRDYDRWGFKITSTDYPTYKGMAKLSKYAFKNRHEYFAVAMDKFICEPENLKKHAPELFDVLKTKIFGNRDFLGVEPAREEYHKNVIRERKESAPTFQLDHLAGTIIGRCLGGPPFQAKYATDPVSGQKQVYYLKKGFVRHLGKVKSALIGRTGRSDYYRKCFQKEGQNLAQKIVDDFFQCHPPDMRGLVEGLLQRVQEKVATYDELVKNKSLSPKKIQL